ncbi:MAG: hypothetical protein LAO07_14360 [Acidobacteriia bacterium]|nr:hypothetical protein [Terriglobia bacterium]
MRVEQRGTGIVLFAHGSSVEEASRRTPLTIGEGRPLEGHPLLTSNVPGRVRELTEATKSAR